MAKKSVSTKADKAADKKKGIKEGSPQDEALDKKGGFVPFVKKSKAKPKAKGK